jgi:fructose-bisphosphate aldolase, class II
MFDGSSLPLEENLRIADALLEECARAGVVLEVECGVVGGEEDDVRAGEGDRLYTTPDEMLRVAEVLGTGERGRYLLAPAFGNVHGRHEHLDVELRPALLREGRQALAEAHPGARFDYVFHGSSGYREARIAEAISHGVVKVNIDSDAQYAFSRAVADYLAPRAEALATGAAAKTDFDPRSWGRLAEGAMAERVAQACETVGSAGRSLLA